MDVLRKNTDYGLRMMAALAEHFNDDQLISARQLASDGHFSYQLGCKLLQKLHRAKLVKSGMGPKDNSPGNYKGSPGGNSAKQMFAWRIGMRIRIGLRDKYQAFLPSTVYKRLPEWNYVSRSNGRKRKTLGRF